MIETERPKNQHFQALNVIGLMSGTSADSIDAACVRIQMSATPLRLLQFSVLGTYTLHFPGPIRTQLLTIMADQRISLEQVCRLDRDLGDLFAKTAQTLVNNLFKEGMTVDLIASHGQTVYHIPPRGLSPGSTLQIAQPAYIAECTGIDVAADFRPRDMAVGGQGAPLVPFADLLLFQHPTRSRAVQNIGGIANVTVVPAHDHTDYLPFAFDTGPGNMIIDACMTECFGQPYDENGQVGASGRLNPAFLEVLMTHPYFDQKPPKTTGREMFGQVYSRQLLSHWRDKLPHADIITTVSHFTVNSIVTAYQNYVLPAVPVKEVVVGGGGVQNAFLMRLLTNRFKELGIEVKRHEAYDIPSQYKEAIAFALLGYATKFGIPNNVASCTGASQSVVLGGIWPGRPQIDLSTQKPSPLSQQQELTPDFSGSPVANSSR